MDESIQSVPSYRTVARLSRALLTRAMREAKGMLPATVLRLHWMAAKHSPDPWRSVESAYLGQSERDPDIMNTLTDLALMSEALACLIAITAEQRTPGSLKLAKTRHVEI